MAARVLMLVLAMVMTVRADNCKSVHSGMMFNTAVTKCDGGSASAEDCGNCCKPDNTLCYGLMMTGEPCADDTGYSGIFDVSQQGVASTAATFTEDCCKVSYNTVDNTCTNATIMMKSASICDVNMVPDVGKAGSAVKADGSDWNAKCCSMKLKCSSVTCGAGMKAKSDAGDCSTIPCEQTDCCEWDDTKCMGVFVNTVGDPKATCSGASFMDASKAGKAATLDTFKTECCTAKATCSDFKAADLSGGDSASASTRQHAVTLSLLFAVVAMMGKQF